MVVSLKCPKEDKKGRVVVLEVFETQDRWCPVRAFVQWKESAQCEVGMPLFRLSTGVPLTGRKLNVVIKELLSKHIDYQFGKVTTHPRQLNPSTHFLPLPSSLIVRATGPLITLGKAKYISYTLLLHLPALFSSVSDSPKEPSVEASPIRNE